MKKALRVTTTISSIESPSNLGLQPYVTIQNCECFPPSLHHVPVSSISAYVDARKIRRIKLESRSQSALYSDMIHELLKAKLLCEIIVELSNAPLQGLTSLFQSKNLSIIVVSTAKDLNCCPLFTILSTIKEVTNIIKWKYQGEDHVKLSARHLALLAIKCPSIRSLSLSKVNSLAEIIPCFSLLKNLKSLHLSGTTIMKGQLGELLKSLESLEKLVLKRLKGDIGSSDFAALEKLPHLLSLKIQDIKSTDPETCVEHLFNCKALEMVSLCYIYDDDYDDDEDDATCLLSRPCLDLLIKRNNESAYCPPIKRIALEPVVESRDDALNSVHALMSSIKHSSLKSVSLNFMPPNSKECWGDWSDELSVIADEQQWSLVEVDCQSCTLESL